MSLASRCMDAGATLLIPSAISLSSHCALLQPVAVGRRRGGGSGSEKWPA